MQLFGGRHSRIIVRGSELLLGRWLFTCFRCGTCRPPAPQKDLDMSGGVGREADRTENKGSSSMQVMGCA